MKNSLSKYYHYLAILFIFIIFFIPLIFKNIILIKLGLKEINVYYEIISTLTSAVAVIIAFVSVKIQNDEIKEQNERADYSLKLEALTKRLDVKLLLRKHSPNLGQNEEFVRESSQILKDIEEITKLMIEKSKNKSDH